MSKDIDHMTPVEIIKAVRAKDLRVIKALVTDGVKVKHIWSLNDVVTLVKNQDPTSTLNVSTVSRWINGKRK